MWSERSKDRKVDKKKVEVEVDLCRFVSNKFISNCKLVNWYTKTYNDESMNNYLIQLKCLLIKCYNKIL